MQHDPCSNTDEIYTIVAVPLLHTLQLNEYSLVSVANFKSRFQKNRNDLTIGVFPFLLNQLIGEIKITPARSVVLRIFSLSYVVLSNDN